MIEAFNNPKVTSVNIGESALPDRDYYCNIRLRGGGGIQRHGDDPQAAFRAAMDALDGRFEITTQPVLPGFTR